MARDVFDDTDRFIIERIRRGWSNQRIATELRMPLGTVNTGFLVC